MLSEPWNPALCVARWNSPTSAAGELDAALVISMQAANIWGFGAYYTCMCCYIPLSLSNLHLWVKSREIMSLKLNIDLISANPVCIDTAVVVSQAWQAARHPPCCCLTISPPVQDRKENQANKTTGRDKDMEILANCCHRQKKKKITWKKII